MCQEIDKPHCFIVKAQTVKFDGLCSTKIKKTYFLKDKTKIIFFLFLQKVTFKFKMLANLLTCANMLHHLVQKILHHIHSVEKWKIYSHIKIFRENKYRNLNSSWKWKNRFHVIFENAKRESIFSNFPHCDIWMPNVAKIGLEWH